MTTGKILRDVRIQIPIIRSELLDFESCSALYKPNNIETILMIDLFLKDVYQLFYFNRCIFFYTYHLRQYYNSLKF